MYVVINVIRQAGERQQGEGGGDEEPGHQAGPEYTGEGHSTQVINMYTTQTYTDIPTFNLQCTHIPMLSLKCTQT
jgi:hypothetical protein